jgi:very-short-patch-repair endonuclease
MEAKCESPIEEIMFIELYMLFRFISSVPFAFMGHDINTGFDNSYGLLQLYSQVQIADYRVDFLLRLPVEDGASVNFVIECDGHEFHERTKEQAARDRSRDRKLQSLGYTVFRFTGSEIWASSERCTYEIMRAFSKKVIAAVTGEKE